MSRFHQHGRRGDPPPGSEPSRQRSGPTDDSAHDGARRWQASPVEQAGGTIGRTAVVGCFAALLVPLIIFLAVAMQNGSWEVDRYQQQIERGKTLSIQQKLDEAMEAFQEASRLRPDSADAHYYIGQVYLERQRWADAEAEARAGIALNASDPSLYNLLAIARGQQGDDEDHFEYLTKAIAVDPTYGTAHRNIGIVYVTRGDFRRAVEELETYLRYEPNANDVADIRREIDRLRALY